MSSELQFRVLRLLDSNPHLSQRELSKSLGVSLGGVNYCLNALIAKGAIKIENFKNNKNKCVNAYLLTHQGIAEKTALTSSFLKSKLEEYEQLKQEIESLTQEAHLMKVAEVLKKVETLPYEIPGEPVGGPNNAELCSGSGGVPILNIGH
jgi:EPS-associated MarR family transcriptional regulator